MSLVLFGTNLSHEMFEYAKAMKLTAKDIKKLLLRNVDAVFANDDIKAWL